MLTTTSMIFVGKDHIKDDIYLFRFKPAQPLPHRAGQHGLLKVPGFWLPKPFSLASAPEDDEVVIATHVRAASRYKQAMGRLQPGDRVRLQGPALRFVLDGRLTDVVFVAQGIGITPFRSLLRHVQLAGIPVHTTLIHVDPDQPVFGEELTALAQEAFYPASRDAFRAQLQQTAGEHPEAVYFLSGSGAFVRSAAKQLKAAGIASRSIKRDWFLGY